MAQQSTTEPRGTEKHQGSKTREHQKAMFEGREKTKGVDVDTGQKPLAQARSETEAPAGEFEISHGDRSIERGSNQESEHHKRRSE